ncbi:MAG: lytic transglycosylase domain-containing protein [Rhodocyclaceae bacterium]|nr:lytic transglycosylase domain-containing protein [Rhodocyclaceae bacterium]
MSPHLPFVVLALTFPAMPVRADIYQLNDDNEVLHLSDRPDGDAWRLLLRGPGDHGEGSTTRPGNLAALVAETAARHELDPLLLHALVSVESAYRPQAVSPKGARGLTQLMPETARRYGVRDAFDPQQNLEAGARYLRDLLAMFGQDRSLALAAFNAGAGAVIRAGYRIPSIRETRVYVAEVLRRAAERTAPPQQLRNRVAIPR